MSATKKVFTTGRFKARYGVGIRKRVIKIELNQKQKHECPFCGVMKVKRVAAGVFQCRKCSSSFAGGAFLPVTMTGSIVKKIIAQKSFGVTAMQLLEEAEKQEQGSLQEGPSSKEQAKLS